MDEAINLGIVPRQIGLEIEAREAWNSKQKTAYPEIRNPQEKNEQTFNYVVKEAQKMGEGIGGNSYDCIAGDFFYAFVVCSIDFIDFE